jgi:antitoxin (DNA-binding transcriptional repressor) of toxin-antitoxin stability system
MRIMTAEDFTRDVCGVLDRFERDKEEVVILRDNQPIARLVPGGRLMAAREAFAGLGGILTDEEGEAWLRDIKGLDRLLDQGIRDPWE